MDISARNCTAK